jgi:hypothetical protein
MGSAILAGENAIRPNNTVNAEISLRIASFLEIVKTGTLDATGTLVLILT